MRISDWSSDVCSSDLRGSSILVSGVAGAGKSSVAASIVDAACSRGEKALYFSFEESEFQTVRNMRSIGIDLQKWVEAGLLRYVAARPTLYGLEMHLAVKIGRASCRERVCQYV